MLANNEIPIDCITIIIPMNEYNELNNGNTIIEDNIINVKISKIINDNNKVIYVKSHSINEEKKENKIIKYINKLKDVIESIKFLEHNGIVFNEKLNNTIKSEKKLFNFFFNICNLLTIIFTIILLINEKKNLIYFILILLFSTFNLIFNKYLINSLILIFYYFNINNYKLYILKYISYKLYPILLLIIYYGFICYCFINTKYNNELSILLLSIMFIYYTSLILFHILFKIFVPFCY